ncbi:Rv3235 family protein [Nocardia kruczakiae]|uniref:Rv3235 family protein n=2 Tax=Nocardia kruczakiae TaxID=261477 RepID=UPI00350E3F37
MCMGFLLDSSRKNDASCGVNLVITLSDAPLRCRSPLWGDTNLPRGTGWDLSRRCRNSVVDDAGHGMLVRSVPKHADQGECRMLESSASPVYTRRARRAPICEPPLDPKSSGDRTPLDRGTADHGVPRLRAPRRSAHDGRSPASGAGAPAPRRICEGDENSSAAAAFAEKSLRLVLEVIDGRRPLGQLRSVVEPTVLAAVETLARTAAAERRLGTAVLVTVRLAEVTGHTAEVCGGYERGERRFAVAARLVLRRGHWRMSALRMR